MTEIIALSGVSRNFVKPLDLAARIANLFGAGMRETVVRAVDGVDLAIARGRGRRPGRRVGLRQVDARAHRRRHPAAERGQHGVPRRAAARALATRQRKQAALAVQMIFQDPMASLNPRLRVTDIVGEAPVVHGIVTRAQRDDYVVRDAAPRRARSELSQPLSAPVLRRPARPHRHRARARGAAEIPRVRRIGRGARRLDPGAGAQPVHAAARATSS